MSVGLIWIIAICAGSLAIAFTALALFASADFNETETTP